MPLHLVGQILEHATARTWSSGCTDLDQCRRRSPARERGKDSGYAAAPGRPAPGARHSAAPGRAAAPTSISAGDDHQHAKGGRIPAMPLHLVGQFLERATALHLVELLHRPRSLPATITSTRKGEGFRLFKAFTYQDFAHITGVGPHNIFSTPTHDNLLTLSTTSHTHHGSPQRI